MKHSEKLNFVLNILCESKEFVASKDLYSKTQNKIDSEELTPIINKLYFDNYIEKKISARAKNTQLTPPYFCRITYSGLLFVERGGYVSETIRVKRNSLWTKTKTIANFLNALLILIIAALGVYVSWDSKKKDNLIETNKSKIERLELELQNMRSEAAPLKVN